MGLRVWWKNWRYERAQAKALARPCPLADEPEDCPGCSARIVREGDDYVCAGLRSPSEVTQYLGHRFDGVILFRPPCGWRRSAEGYGTIWA
jgi:hypothetical protein